MFRISVSTITAAIKTDDSFVSEDLLPHLDVPGGHQPPALPRDLGDHHGDAVVAVPEPVYSLALLSTVGDGVTLLALGELLLAMLLTRVTRVPVSQRLRHFYDPCKWSGLLKLYCRN